MTLEILFNKMFGYPCWREYAIKYNQREAERVAKERLASGENYPAPTEKKWRVSFDALPPEDIEQLYQAQKATRFFRVLQYLESDLPLTISVFFSRLWDKTYWAFRHRFIQKEWMVDTKLDRYKYHNQDERLIASIFEQLVAFIEDSGEYGDLGRSDEAWEQLKVEDPEYYEARKNIREELLAARNYWKVGRPVLEKSIEDIYAEIPHRENKGHSVFFGMTDAGREERTLYYKRIEEVEKQLEELDERHLISIIKHRRHLWN